MVQATCLKGVPMYQVNSVLHSLQKMAQKANFHFWVAGTLCCFETEMLSCCDCVHLFVVYVMSASRVDFPPIFLPVMTSF